jgi:hypothetical protein
LGLLHHVGERSAGPFWLGSDAGKHFLRKLFEKMRSFLEHDPTFVIVPKLSAQDSSVTEDVPRELARGCDGGVCGSWVSFHWRT